MSLTDRIALVATGFGGDAPHLTLLLNGKVLADASAMIALADVEATSARDLGVSDGSGSVLAEWFQHGRRYRMMVSRRKGNLRIEGYVTWTGQNELDIAKMDRKP